MIGECQSTTNNRSNHILDNCKGCYFPSFNTKNSINRSSDWLCLVSQIHQEQYDACACEVPPITCSENNARRVIVPCIPDLGGSFRISNPDGNQGVVDSYDPGVTYYIAGKHNRNELSTLNYIAITYFQAFQMAVMRNVIHHG